MNVIDCNDHNQKAVNGPVCQLFDSRLLSNGCNTRITISFSKNEIHSVQANLSFLAL